MQILTAISLNSSSSSQSSSGPSSHAFFFFFSPGKCSISSSQRSLTNLVEVKAYVAGYTHWSSGGFYGKRGVPQKAVLLLLFNKKSPDSFWKISEGRKASRSINGFPKGHVLFAVRLRHCSPMSNLRAICRNIYSWAMVSLHEVPT